MNSSDERDAINQFANVLRKRLLEYIKEHPTYDEVAELENQGYHFVVDYSTLEISYVQVNDLEQEDNYWRESQRFVGKYCIQLKYIAMTNADGLYLDSYDTNGIASDCVMQYIWTHNITEYNQMPPCCQLTPEEKARREEEERRWAEEKERKRIEILRVRTEHAFDPKEKPLALIIPDVHGRTFWKDAVARFSNLPVIFLGDYLDPYQNYIERIKSEDALTNLQDILAFQATHQENITLLLGNHDLHYLTDDIDCSRKDEDNLEKIRQLFIDNLHIFSLATSCRTESKEVLFSHAGVLPDWMDLRMPGVPHDSCQKICNAINAKREDVEFLSQLVRDASRYRGGRIDQGSPVWADVTEHESGENNSILSEEIFQIFGHSQQDNNPVYGQHYACLDCRRAFVLANSGAIMEIADPDSLPIV